MLPAACRLAPTSQWLDEVTLLGGTPRRRIRLSPTGAAIVRAAIGGQTGPLRPAERALLRHLLDALILAPSIEPLAPLAVGIVIPVRDDADGLRRTLRACGATLSADAPGSRAFSGANQPSDARSNRPPVEVTTIVVVDDGSARAIDAHDCRAALSARTGDDTDARRMDPTRPARRGPRLGVVRRARSGGPAAARNTGWSDLEEPVIAFLDADVVVGPGWLETLVQPLADPTVGLTAPRVVAAPRDDTHPAIGAFEARHFPLDLGPEPGWVGPGLPITYLPGAALVVRRPVLTQLDGFDSYLRVGEDVDFIYRALDAGWRVRYVPSVVVAHPPRETAAALCRQRLRYGRSAGTLSRRHPELGRRALSADATPSGNATPSGDAGTSRNSGRGAPPPPSHRREAVVRRAGRLAPLACRELAPLTACGLLFRRTRLPTALLFVVPAFRRYREERPSLDVVRYVGLYVLDNLFYGLGVVIGSIETRTTRPLRSH